ncbi:MAG TPA: phosphonate ABC transporter, permease protein PhnE [Candidatus Limnocylindria bacterium]|nr:phosphonate ABC transporter, permease protein PhnE [Candidatus Limnocylindria bacterium]
MAEYFRARNMPVPPELERNWLTDWRRLLAVAATAAVLAIGLQITGIDTSRANPPYVAQILGQLLTPNWDVLFPQVDTTFCELPVEECPRGNFWEAGLGLMIVTIFMAVVATAFAFVIALPLSFLGARNVMTGNPLTSAVYAVVRVLFTIIRSIDILIVCIVGVVLFQIGNGAGVFAIAFHNVGVMGKLYSEAIEGIDPGPIEAITATGANRFQVIWTAVLPQIVNPYVSLTIYRLDTNVRLAPVIGLVGAGGIGVLLFQYMNLLHYHEAGALIFLIVVTVAVMDFVSAQVRKRLA